jgi:NAD(P)-dependent dehydrogenase (short-subunit alcohol dehydrogenase family)
MRLLRDGLLDGARIAITGSVAAEVRTALGELGASFVDPDSGAQALVYDADDALRTGGLTAALEEAWSAVAAVAAHTLIPAGQPGKIVLIAPRPDVADHAEAVRAGLENLARTLSIEWARYGITTTSIAPGLATSDEELTTLVCYLLSPAGDYFSGCRFDLGSVEADRL